jgi:tetrahydromethanopterin S-methyltransferase subunit B
MQTSTTVMSIDKQRGMIMTGIERFMVRVMELEERIKELESQVAALQNNS